MENIIGVKGFYKSFGRKKVITDLNFEVRAGEIFAFIGANGSGKTTTLRALLSIYSPDKGELLINGQKYNYKMCSLLGYLPEERGLYMSSKVLETLVYFGRLKGLSTVDSKKRALEYLQKVDLADKANTEIKKLSSGQQQKIQLGITIINKPKLLILDEPTKGLDPVNRDLLMTMLMDLNKSGSTILFSTHQMEEAEKIAERILMIKNGKKALYGELDEIKKSFGDNTIQIHFHGDFPENENLYRAKIQKNYAEVTPNANTDSTEILKYLLAKNLQVVSFGITTPTLQEIFVEVSKSDKY